MLKDNAIKKLSIVVASLALILPLASVSNVSVSANAKPAKRVARMVRKSHRAKPVKKAKRAHHYYKFAYNKKEYRKALHYIAVNNEDIRKLNKKYASHKSKAFKLGFNDALQNTGHPKLVNSKQYELGYLIADAADIDGKVNKKTINRRKAWYNDFKKNGPATAPAIDQIKWEAHIDTL